VMDVTEGCYRTSEQLELRSWGSVPGPCFGAAVPQEFLLDIL
jgi:hypothetical protein